MDDEYFNGADYVTIDGGINNNDNYPSSNNDICGSHHEETKESYPSENSTIKEPQVTQVPFSTPEIKTPFKGLSKFIFFNKKNVKKEDTLNNLVYDNTIPILEKVKTIDKTKEKLEAEDIDRVKQLQTLDEKIEQATKNRDQLEKDLQIARFAKDKSNSELIKAEQELIDNFKTKFALIKQEKNLKKESIVKIKFILSKVDIMNVASLDLKHSDINDFGAKYIADSLEKGDLPNLNALDVSGNQITTIGTGYLAKGLEAVTQDLKIVLDSVKGFSKDALKTIMKGMLSIATNNGISTKEMLTTDETIEHCKKGTVNVGVNIGVGYIKCFTKLDKPIAIYNMDFQTLGIEVLTNVFNPLKKPMQFICMVESTVFSVVDEDFANCLTGLDSGFE